MEKKPAGAIFTVWDSLDVQKWKQAFKNLQNAFEKCSESVWKRSRAFRSGKKCSGVQNNHSSFGVDIFTLRRYQDTYLYQFNTHLNRRHYYANIDTFGQTPSNMGFNLLPKIYLHIPIGSMVLVYMLTWLGYIDGIHVAKQIAAPWISHGIYHPFGDDFPHSHGISARLDTKREGIAIANQIKAPWTLTYLQYCT